MSSFVPSPRRSYRDNDGGGEEDVGGAVHYPCLNGAFAALAAHLYFKAVSFLVSFPNTVYNLTRSSSLHRF